MTYNGEMKFADAGHSCLCFIFAAGGQEKHGFAAHKQGARSQRCCGESPRALGQRVPAGDCRAPAWPLAVKPRAELKWPAGVVRSSTAMNSAAQPAGYIQSCEATLRPTPTSYPPSTPSRCVDSYLYNQCCTTWPQDCLYNSLCKDG